jgi:hypothetical protein
MFKRRFLGIATVVAALALIPSERVALAQGATPEESVQALIDEVNEVLEAQGSELRVLSADFLTRGKSGHDGRKAVWRKRGFERADAEFVPFDKRRIWSGSPDGEVDDITFAIDQSLDASPPLGGLSGAATTAAIRRATASWDRVRCSGLKLTEVSAMSDVGVIAFVANKGKGGAPTLVADIVHAGFRNLSNWSKVPSMPGLLLHDDIVAVTFTFVFTSDGKTLTDIDQNGKWDVGFHEIYYNPSVTWSDKRKHKGHDDDDDDDDRRRHKHVSQEDVESYDVETVALHEIGHALALAHSGHGGTRRHGSLDAKPQAVMNPIYTGVQRRLHGTDVAAHCIGGWKTWPKAKRNRDRDRDD